MLNSLRLLAAISLTSLVACAPVQIGRRYSASPRTEVKVGFHTKADVEGKMGPPFRKAVDARGREIYTYVWADGKGGGEKCVIAFNKNGVVYLVETYP